MLCALISIRLHNSIKKNEFVITLTYIVEVDQQGEKKILKPSIEVILKQWLKLLKQSDTHRVSWLPRVIGNYRWSVEL